MKNITLNTLSPIDQFLVECIRFKAGNPKKIEIIAGDFSDWRNLIKRAEAQGIIGWVHETLSHVDPRKIDEGVVNELKRRRVVYSARAVAASECISEVLDAFRRDGIKVLVLKGPFLAENIYERANLRFFGDLDLLVQEEDVCIAEKCLGRIGYSSLTPERYSFFRKGRTQGHYAKKGCLPVDLHWKLINLPSHSSSFDIDMEKVWAEAKETSIAGNEVLVLSAEDTFIFQCLHLAAHHDFNRLIWFKDVQQVVWRLHTQIDWELVCTKAKDYRLNTFIYYALLMTEQVCEKLDVPKSVFIALKPKYFTARLFDRLIQKTNILELHSNKRKPVLELWRIMRDDRRSRYQALIKRFFPEVEWYLDCYPFLPRIRYPKLYYPLYPGLFIMRIFKRPNNIILSD